MDKVKALIPLMILCLTSCTPNSPTTSVDSSTQPTTNTTTSDDSSDNTTTSEDEKMDITKCVSTQQIDDYKKSGYSPLFTDVNFKKGFRTTKTFYDDGESPYHDDKKIDFYNLYPNVSNYGWTIAQWSSKYDLMDTNGYSLSKDKTGLINTITGKGKIVNGKFTPSKQLVFNSLTGGFSMEVNTSIEYDQPRVSSDPWVHLLLESKEMTYRSQKVRLNDFEQIIMEANYTVTRCEDKMNGQANSNVHAAQLVWYVTLQNLNKKSEEYGKYIWFGINLFDNRNVGKTTTLYNQLDKGTGTGIYSPGSFAYCDGTNGKIPQVGQKARAKLDIRLFAEAAYNAGKEKGYFGTTTFDDLYIGGGNFGYEIPGTYDITTEFESINIFVKE